MDYWRESKFTVLRVKPPGLAARWSCLATVLVLRVRSLLKVKLHTLYMLMSLKSYRYYCYVSRVLWICPGDVDDSKRVEQTSGRGGKRARMHGSKVECIRNVPGRYPEACTHVEPIRALHRDKGNVLPPLMVVYLRLTTLVTTKFNTRLVPLQYLPVEDRHLKTRRLLVRLAVPPNEPLGHGFRTSRYPSHPSLISRFTVVARRRRSTSCLGTFPRCPVSPCPLFPPALASQHKHRLVL